MSYYKNWAEKSRREHPTLLRAQKINSLPNILVFDEVEYLDDKGLQVSMIEPSFSLGFDAKSLQRVGDSLEYASLLISVCTAVGEIWKCLYPVFPEDPKALFPEWKKVYAGRVVPDMLSISMSPNGAIGLKYALEISDTSKDAIELVSVNPDSKIIPKWHVKDPDPAWAALLQGTALMVKPLVDIVHSYGKRLYP